MLTFKQTSRFLRLILLPLSLWLLPNAFAQFNASLSGTVEDTTGAIIPGATVTLSNLGTQQTQSATSTGEGFYRFNELPPAHYKLVVTATGFSGSTFDDIALSAETPRNVDVKLTTGANTESVTVNADTVPVLQTSSANIQTTIDSEAIKRLPTFGADPFELLRTAPGITGSGARTATGSAVFLPNGGGPGGSNAGVFQTENQVQVSADGQRQADNNFTIDGVSVNSLTHGGAAVVTPSQEAVGQLTIVSTSYDASDGRNSGAQIKVVTQSGTNQFHGSGFFLYNEPGLNSFNKFGGPTPGTLPTKVNVKQRSYAASLGGPIRKDKLFLFASYAGFTLANNSTTTGYVETPAFRAAVLANRPGGISAKVLADPSVQPRILQILTPNCSGFNPYTPPVTTTNPTPVPQPSCQVVNGGLDIGSLTPGGASQLGIFPAVNVGAGLDGVADVESAQFFVPSRSRGNQFNGRVDLNLTPKDLIAGSVYVTKLDNYGTSGTASSRPQADLPFKPLNSAATLIFIHTFGPRWLNELRGNATRFAENGLRDAGNTVNFGLPYVNVQQYPFPIQYGVSFSGSSPAIFAENTYELRDVVTHTFGSHSLRIGGEVRLEQDNDNLLGQQRPTFAFNGLFAFANDAAIFEQVTANPITGGVGSTQRYFRSEDFAAYLQHDWKVSQNLTLNMGLRWEEFTPLRNKGSKIYYPVLGTTPGRELVDITLQAKDQLWAPQHNNYAPKVSFAYTPPALNQKVVLRGGFAMAYNHLDIALFNNALENGPGSASFNLCCASNTGNAGVQYATGTSNSPTSFPVNPALKTGTGANGFPNQPTNGVQSQSVEVYGASPHIRYPMSYLYSMEVQYELPKQTTLTIGYAGSLGRHYARLVDQNILYNQCLPATLNCDVPAGAPPAIKAPVFRSFFAQTDSNQSYNALNVQANRRLSHGFAISANYTYAKSLDQVSNGDAANSNANQTNPADNASEYGPSDYDIRHHVTATALYELPHVHTSHKLVEALVNGFQVNTILTYYTGFPWTPVTFNTQTNPNQIGSARAGPVRPVAYLGGAGTSCSNDSYIHGSNFPNRTAENPGGGNYFNSTTVSGNYIPGIGRNSFRGPCYFDDDISVAKEFGFDAADRHMALRVTANFYNAFNKLQLQPLTNGNANNGANIQNKYFGFAQGGDAGRQIELTGRLQF